MKKADVSFEKKQATITYNPKVTNPAKLIAVVHNAPNMMDKNKKFEAKIHKGK